MLARERSADPELYYRAINRSKSNPTPKLYVPGVFSLLIIITQVALCWKACTTNTSAMCNTRFGPLIGKLEKSYWHAAEPGPTNPGGLRSVLAGQSRENANFARTLKEV